MKLARRLASGETVLTAWSSLASVEVLDLLARSDFDAVTLDMQHGAHDERSVHQGLPSVIALGKDMLPPPKEPPMQNTANMTARMRPSVRSLSLRSASPLER